MRYFLLVLVVTCATLALPPAAVHAQSHGSYCQTPDGGCVVSPPQPMGGYCTCGGSAGTITG